MVVAILEEKFSRSAASVLEARSIKARLEIRQRIRGRHFACCRCQYTEPTRPAELFLVIETCDPVRTQILLEESFALGLSGGVPAALAGLVLIWSVFESFPDSISLT